MIDLEDVRNVQCNYCQQPFEIEPAAPEDGYDEPEIDVPVECDKGKFCCDGCRAHAMYEAQDEAGRECLRRYYLGASLASENHRAVERIVEDWDIELLWDRAECDADLWALFPEGSISGKEGAEDDCDALLMPKDTRAIIRNALFDGKMAAEMAVYRAEQIKYLGDEYKASEIARTKEKVAAIEAAMVALNGCKGVL
jgi:hypothetical protein